MKVTITPKKLRGNIEAISSKSYLHRMILCAALCESDTVIRLNCRSKDVEATIRCVEAIGARVEAQADRLIVHPVEKVNRRPLLDCGESGSTARFILPMAAVVCGDECLLIGEGRLPERPFGAICSVMEENGCTFSSYHLPMKVTGTLKAGTYRIPANISSQYISALMMSLPLADGDSEIVFTTEVESGGYLDVTEEVMREFGMSVEKTGNGYIIRGKRRYRSPGEISAEGDWSNGAFWIAANALGCELEIAGLKANSLQRDSRIAEVVEKILVGKAAGAHATNAGNGTAALAEVVIDGADIPDIVPIAAIVACKRIGRTRFTHCGRLRLKESDRLASVEETIRALGGKALVEGDDLIVCGSGSLRGGEVQSFGDHRIVMSAAIAAIICRESVIICDAQDADKSYPTFFADYRNLGGDILIVE